MSENPPTPSAPAYAQEFSVQGEGLDVGPVIKVVAQITGFLVVALVILFQWANKEFREAERAATLQTGYPLLRETNADAARLLENYVIIDEAEGVYRIPIDRAIDIVVEQDAESPRQFSNELRLAP